MNILAFEPETHAVTTFAQTVLGIEKTPLLYRIKCCLLVSEYDSKPGTVAVNRLIGLVQAAVSCQRLATAGQVITSL